MIDKSTGFGGLNIRICVSVINEIAKAVKLCIIKQPRHKLPVGFIRWKPSGSLLLLFFRIDFRNGKESLKVKSKPGRWLSPGTLGGSVWSALPTSNCVQLQSELQGLRISSRNDGYSSDSMHAASCVCWQLFHCEGFIIIEMLAMG